jgi:hypothetical protein
VTENNQRSCIALRSVGQIIKLNVLIPFRDAAMYKIIKVFPQSTTRIRSLKLFCAAFYLHFSTTNKQVKGTTYMFA